MKENAIDHFLFSQNNPVSGTPVSRGKLLSFVLWFSFLLIGTVSAYSATITSAASGNWSSTATWTGGVVPSSADIVVIAAGTTVTVDGNYTCSALQMNSTNSISAGTLTVNLGFTLTVTNAISITDGSKDVTFNIQGAGTVSCSSISICSSGGVPGGNAASSFTLASTIANLSVTNNINLYGNATTSGTTKTDIPTLNISSGIVNVGGQITSVNQTGGSTVLTLGGVGGSKPTLNLSHSSPFSLSATGTNTVTLNGNGATVNYTGTGAAQTVFAGTYKNLILSGSAPKKIASAASVRVIVDSLMSMEGTATPDSVPSYGAAATLQYKGSAAQTTGPEFATPWTATGGVIINNANGVTLNASKQINSTLTFTSGILTTTASYNLALGSAATVTGAGASKYVYGTLRRFVPATANLANFSYPVGDASNYAPVSLTFTGTPGGTGSIDASTVITAGAPDAASNISLTQYLKRSWKLTNNSVTGFSSYAPTFTFVSGDIIGGANTAAFIVRVLSATTWYPTTIGTRTTTTTNVTGVTQFGDFYIGEQASATKFAITGSASQTAGGTQNITITALDNNNTTATAYTGTKSLIFSGANASLSPVTQPTITDVNGTAVAFGSPVSITFVAGVAQVSGTGNGVMKLYRAEVANISVTDGSISATGSNRLTVTVSAASASKLSFSTQPGSGISNANLSPQPKVSILDMYGNLVSSATNAITLAIANNAGPGATLSITTNPLNAVGGVASFSGVKLDITGIGYTLLATASSLTSTTSSSFNISSGPATKLVITGLNTQAAGATQSITITAKDASNNTTSAYNGDKELIFSGANSSPGPVVSYPTITDKSGTAKAFGTATILTFVNGVATVALKLYKAEIASITSTDGSITADADRLSVTVSPSSGTQLTFTTQPGNGVSLTALSTQPVVKVLDAYGNVATGSSSAVTLSIANNVNSGTLSVTTNPLAASSGVAAFSGVKINKAGAGYTVTASASGLTSATSNSFSITAAAAAIMQYNAGNNQFIPVLMAVKVKPSVLVTDASGNPVAGTTVTFSVTAGGGSVTGASAITDASGIATVGSWTLGSNIGTNTLQASVAGLSGSPVSFTATAVAQIVCPSFNKRNNGEGSGDCYPGDVVGVNIPGGKQKSGIFSFNDGAANYGVTQVLLNGSLYQEGSVLYQGSIFFGGFNATTRQICFYGNSQSDNATPAGNWKFNFTDAYGNAKYCDYVVTATGDISTLVPGTIAADQTICAGNTPASLTSSADASGSTGITYQWQKSTTSVASGYTNISGATSAAYAPGSLTSTTYFIRIATDKSGLSVNSNAVTITVNPAPSKPVVSVEQPSCNVATGTITVVPSGNAGDTYSKDGITYTNTTGVFTSLLPGTYSITVKNSYGCISVASSVTVNPTPAKPSQPVISSSASGTVCAGTGVVLTSTSIASGKYQWYKSGVAIVGATSRTYTTYQSGSYTVTTTDGCTSDPSATAVVTISAIPTASITQSTQLALGGDCSQTTISLIANSDAVSPTYQWKKNGVDIPGATQATYAATEAATYTVAISQNGCSAVSPASVIATMPSASATGATTVCQGNTVHIEANTTGLTNPAFQWQVSSDGINNFTNVAGTSTNASYDAAATGYYRVAVSYDGITVTSCAIRVTVNALPTVTVNSSATNLCSGSTATLTASAGGASPYAYQWKIYGTPISNANNATYITGLSASYSVQVTDNNGCENTSANTIITVNDLPTVTGQLSVCGANTSSQLTGSGIPASSGAWVSGNTSIATVNATGLVTAVSTGTTTITYTNANGCSTSPSFSVQSAPTATVSAGSLSVCSGSNINFTISGTNDAVVTYTINDGLRQTTTLTGGSATITIQEAVANQTLTLLSIQSSDGGCTQNLSAAVTVTVNPLPVVGFISGVSNVCVGATTQLFSAATNGTTSWTTSSPAVTLNATGGTVTVTGVSAGTATIWYTITNSNNCTTSVSTDITVNPLPTIAGVSGTLTICSGLSTTLTASSAAASPTYNWYTATSGGSLLYTGAAYTTAALTGTTSFYVDVTSEAGCVSISRTAVTVTVNSLPTISGVSGTLSICSGLSTSLTASSGTTSPTYHWYNAANGGSLLYTGAAYTTAALTSTSNFYVEVTSDAGCVSLSRTEVAVTVNSLPTISGVSGTLTVCSGLSTTLTASSAAASPTYNWYTAASGGSLLFTGTAYTTVALTTTTSFYVGVTSGAGCVSVSRTQVTVTVNPTPTISGVSGTLTLCSGLGTTLTASSAATSPTYKWYTAASGGALLYTGAAYATAALTETTNFYVDVTSESGCVSVSRTGVTVTVNPLPTISGVSGTLTICSGLSTTLTASSVAATPTDKWYTAPSGGSLLYTGAAYTTASLTTTTSFYVSVTSGAGCESVSRTEVTVTVNPLPTISGVTGTLTICSGFNTTLTASSGTASPTYKWYTAASGGTLLYTGAAYTTAALTNTTSFYVDVTSEAGCVAASRTQVTVTVNPTPTISGVTGTLTICSGLSTTLTANSGATSPTYNWYTAASGGSLLYTGAAYTTASLTTTTSFYVDVTSDAGCVSVSRTAVTVMVNPLPTISGVTGNLTICAGTNTTLTANSGASSPTYNWYTAASGGSLLYTGAAYTTASLTTTTSFYVSVTSGAGCEFVSRTEVTVTVNPLPTISGVTGVLTVCSGLSTTLTASSGTASPTYKWYTAATGGSLLYTGAAYTTAALATTTSFYVDVTSEAGCVAASRTQVTVTVNPTPTISGVTGTLTICSGLSTTLTANSGATSPTYQWYTAASGGSLLYTGAVYATGALTSTTRYYVGVTSEAGCESVSRTEVTVTVFSAVEITGSINSLCVSSTYDFTGSGTAASVNAWTSSDINIATVSAGRVTGISGGTVAITYTDNNGCQAVKNLRITALPSTDLITTSPTAANVCISSLITYRFPAGQLRYGWGMSDHTYTDMIIQSGGITQADSVLSLYWRHAGNHTLYLNYQDTSGCWSPILTITKTVSAVPAVSVSPVSPVVCSGTDAVFQLTGTAGAVVTYQINGGAQLNTTLTGGTAAITITGVVTTQTISLVSISLGECTQALSNTAVVTINTVPAQPSTITGFSSVCAGSSLTYYVIDERDLGKDVTSWTWQLPSGWTGSSTDHTIDVVSSVNAGTITVTANNACGASLPRILQVTVTGGVELLSPSFTVSSLSECVTGNSFVFTNTSSGPVETVSWNFEDGTPLDTARNTVHSFAAANNYDVTLTVGGSGCSTSVSKNIIVDSIPTATVSAAVPAVCTGAVVTFNITGTVGAVVTYKMNGGADQQVTLTTGSAAITVTGSGSVQSISLVAVSKNTCTAVLSATASVTVNPLPVITITADVTSICQDGDHDWSKIVTYKTESGKTNYGWTAVGSNPADYIIYAGGASTDSVFKVIWTSAGTKTAKVNYTDANGCRATVDASTTVTVLPSPTLGTISQLTPVCSGTNATIVLTGLVPSAGQTITYDIDGGNATGVFVTSDTTGNASFQLPVDYAKNGKVIMVNQIELTTGCEEVFTTNNTGTLAVKPLPVISGTLTASYGTAITLTGNLTPAAATPWVSGNTAVAGISDAGVVSVASIGTSTITYQANNGCSISALLTITAAPLTITLQDQQKIYGVTGSLGSTAFTVTGLADGETINHVTLSSTGTSATATVGTYSITGSAATGNFTATNYTISYVPGTLTVTAAPLTITANDQTKVYGVSGNLGTSAFTVTGLASGESISGVTLTSPGTLSTTSVGTYSITASGATGTTVSNYTINYVSATLTVTTAPLTITANDQNKVYGVIGNLGTSAFSVTGLAAGESISGVTLSSPGTLSTATVGTYSITASGATGTNVSNYTISYISGTLTVTAAPLTITADNQTKVYGVSGNLGTSAFSITGMAAGESISGVTLNSPGTLSTAAAGTYSITASGAAGTTVSNYTISYVSGTLTVTAAPLTITADNQTKVYGVSGNLGTSAFTVTGLAAGESISGVTLSSPGTLSTATVGAYSITASSATGTTVSNYTINYISGTLTVTAAPLTITADNQTKVYGITGNLGTNAFSVTGLVAGESISSVTLNSPGTLSTAAVGTYSITASGATGTTVSNYTINYVSGTLTVTAAPLTITANDQTKVYGVSGNLGTSAFSVTGLAAGESISGVTLSSPGTLSTATVGAYSITASSATGTTVSNYTINYVSGTLTVTAAPLTITADNQTKVYGITGNLGTNAFSVTGLVAGESISSVSLNSPGTLSTAAAGTYSLTASGATGITVSNYTINYVSGTLTVTAAPLTITANDQNKVYGVSGNLGTSAFSVTGLVAGESISSVSLNSPGTLSTAAAGTYSLTASGATGTTVSNYTINYVSGTLTVTAAPLTITANDQNKIYGVSGNLGTSTFSVTGLAAGESISAVTLSSPGTLSTAATGTYSITASGATGTTLFNYTINYVSGTLTVTAAPLTITANDQTKVYGVSGNLGTNAFSVMGLAAGESISGVTLTSPGTLSTATAGSYSITASGATGTTVSNYTINYIFGTLTITAAPLTITANDQNKVYGVSGNLGTSAFSVTGLATGESISGVMLNSPGTLSTAAVGTYSVTASGATGATVANYTITYVSGTLTVTAAPLTITANDQNKVYGVSGNLGTSAFSVTGLVAGESISGITLSSLGTLSTATAGTYSITASGATGTTVANYSINYVSGTLTVTAAPLTITADNQTKVYGVSGNLGASAFSVTGLAAGESISGITLSSAGNLSTATVGTYSITVSGATGTTVSNYTINYVSGTLTVTALPLTITVNDQRKVYGINGTLDATAFSVTGLATGEQISGVTLNSPGTLSTAAVGTYSITASNAIGLTVSNYTINYVAGTLTVSAAPLTITANDHNKVYGVTGNLGTGSFSVTGLAAGESISTVIVSSAGILSTAAVGNYSITASGATGATVANYTITYVSGTLRVSAAPLTITANAQQKVYGETVNLGTAAFSVTGLAAGESISSVTLNSAGTLSTAAKGTYSITASGATGNSIANYTINYLPGTLTVTAAPLTITASDVVKNFGSAIELTLYNVTGLVTGESISSVSMTSPGTSATAAAGIYSITISGANGAGLSNYQITYVSGSLQVSGAAQPLTPGTIESSQVVCEGAVPAPLRSVTNAAGGAAAIIRYQWQQSRDSVAFTNIAGANSATYILPVHNNTFYYRRTAYTATDSAVYSNIVSIKVLSLPVINGALTGDCAVIADSVKLYSVTAAVNATRYAWTLPTGWKGSSDSNRIQVIPAANNGVISVVPYNNSCVGTGVSLTVSVIDLAKSTLTANPNKATGDNLNTATVTLQLIDVAGNPINCSAPAISFCSTTGAVIGTVTDNNNGSYSAKVRSYADTVVVCASIGNTRFKQTATITFSGPQAGIAGNGPIFATEIPYLTFNITQGVAPYTIIYRAGKNTKTDTLTNVTSNVPVGVSKISSTTGYKLLSVISADNGRRKEDFVNDSATIKVIEPRILITLTSDQPKLVRDSTYGTRLSVNVSNNGDVNLKSVQVSANLADVFPAPVDFVLDSVSFNGNTVKQNPQFDGKNSYDLFAWNGIRGSRMFEPSYPQIRQDQAAVMAMTTIPAIISSVAGLQEEGLADAAVEMASPVTYLSNIESVQTDAPMLTDAEMAAAPSPYFFGTLSSLAIGEKAEIFLYVSIKPNGYKKPFVMQVAATGTGYTSNGAALANSISNDNERQAVHPELTKQGEPLPTVIALLPDPLIGLSLQTGTPVLQSDSSYNVDLKYVIGNYGNVNLRDMALYQNLLKAIPSPSVYKVLSVTTGTGSLVLNKAFDGKLDTNLLSPLSTLPYDRQGEVKMVINIKPGSYSSQYKLQALATGFASESQSTVSDLSTDGTNPDANGDAVPDESLVSYISINKLIPVLDAGNIGFTNAASEEKRLQASFCGATSAVVVSQLTAPSGGDETYRFQWQQSADNITYKNIPGAVSSTYTTGTVSENTYLRRSVISGNQLKYSEAVLIRINAISKPVISTAGPLVLSANDSVTIVASTASAYQWSTGATSQSLIVKQAGTYAVTVVDNNGCQAVSDTITVLPPPPVAVNATYIIGAISNPADISVQVKRTTTGATIRYYASITAAGNINTPALPSVPGTMVYYVSQVVNGLESTKVPVQVTMLTPATISKLEKTVSTKATLQADGSFIIGFTFHTYNLRNELLDSVMIKDDLTKVFPASAKWEVLSVMASGKLVANPFYNGITQTELLSVQSQLPGAQRDSVNLALRVYPNGFAGDLLNTARQTAVSPYGKFELQSTDPSVVNASGAPVPTRFNIPVVEIFIPDGFSPNRDGKNDTYVIIKPYTVRISLEIFNRWGNPVYRSQDYQNEWDGKGNQSSLFGTDLADGTYYYIVTATDKQTGKTDRFKGFVVLKR